MRISINNIEQMLEQIPEGAELHPKPHKGKVNFQLFNKGYLLEKSMILGVYKFKKTYMPNVYHVPKILKTYKSRIKSTKNDFQVSFKNGILFETALKFEKTTCKKSFFDEK